MHSEPTRPTPNVKVSWDADWIWLPDSGKNASGRWARNSFVRFRRSFSWQGGPTALHITADSRYVLYINGEYVGQGPVRSWPAHPSFDTYDATPYLRPGRNVIAVIVNHWGEGNFQYITQPPGLLIQLEVASRVLISTDSSWRVANDEAFARVTPRVSVQQAFEEQYDARLADNWTEIDYDDIRWPQAVVLNERRACPAQSLAPRDIPFLTLDPVLPKRILQAERVRPVPHVSTVFAKPYLAPKDLSSNMLLCHAYLFTQIYTPAATEATLIFPQRSRAQFKVNGKDFQSAPLPSRGHWAPRGTVVRLAAGWNSLLVKLSDTDRNYELVVALDSSEPIQLSCRGAAGGAAWAVVGPFELTPRQEAIASTYKDESLIISEPFCPIATAATGTSLWQTNIDVTSLVSEPFFQEIQKEHLPEANSYTASYTDDLVDDAQDSIGSDALIESPDALLSENHDWAVVHPDPQGHDVRLLIDFGQEVVGFHKFDVEAAAGTILDWHNFEFIQRDGRYNLAEGMHNSFRYTCREGRQQYQTYSRRGFRYSFLTLRNMQGPVRLRLVEVLFNTYPQANRGSLSSSDPGLDAIWRVGAHTLRCCAEDTYVDCPTYEQVNWVGDARNEALIDWVINGDPRLWFHCLTQTAQSLERSPITESHVPSAWQDLLPAWSFLWMCSCREYVLYTGDLAGGASLLPWLERNVVGIATHLNQDGLFEIRAWNMFDWAAMDTPALGVVTHQNCLAVMALRAISELAQWLNRDDLSSTWTKMADELSRAINKHLWNHDKQAYTDCMRDGQHSTVFSQQTQTAAYISGVAQGERGALCRDILYHAPEGFVKAGSPFFEFFLLEALQGDGRDHDFLDIIRRDWGFMIDEGATTFWEMWSLKGGRLTRSHCHGWSAAPTFFLSTHVLGVKPIAPGFKRVEVAPHPGNLQWCDGVVPTPHGSISVRWENRDGEPFSLHVETPEGVEADIKPPTGSVVVINGRRLETAS